MSPFDKQQLSTISTWEIHAPRRSGERYAAIPEREFAFNRNVLAPMYARTSSPIARYRPTNYICPPRTEIPSIIITPSVRIANAYVVYRQNRRIFIYM